MIHTNNVGYSLNIVRQRLTQAEEKFSRHCGEVRLIAVSKTKPLADIQAAIDAGQRDFGENYLNEALEKMVQLTGQHCRWHYIGAIQSNKTRQIAENFDWVHCVDRLKIAQRLSDQRECKEPLNICVQVNIDQEPSKSGALPEETLDLCRQIASLPRLNLRGLMAIPQASESFDAQRDSCKRLRLLFESIQQKLPSLDTLSVGMSGDLEAAVAEGSTMVRIGSAIFGQRSPKPPPV